MKQLTILTKSQSLDGATGKAPALFLSQPKASERFYSFFAANIRNLNTRRAYYKADGRFSDWCELRGLFDLHQVKPVHVAAYLEMLGLPEPQGAGCPGLR